MKKALIAFAIVSVAYGEDLTAEENQHRLKTCGIPSNELSPWIVTTRTGFHSILVSKRHVIVEIWALFNYDHAVWLTDIPFPVDVDSCKNNIMPIPGGVLDRLYVEMSWCGNIDKCGFDIHEQIVKGYFIGDCKKGPNQLRHGFGILELLNGDNNMTYFQPICISENNGALKSDEAVDQYSNYIKENVKSVGCKNKEPDYDICLNTPYLYNGHSIVRKEGEKSALLGIQSGKIYDKINSHFTSIGYFRDQLCDAVGICSPGAKRKPILSDIKETRLRKLKFRELPDDDFSSSLDLTLVFSATIIISMIMD